MRCARTAERSGTLPETETHRMDTYAPDVKGEGYLHITERTADKLYEAGEYSDYAVGIVERSAELERLHGK